MARSRLSVPSLLGLFCALLMLSPEVLLGRSGSPPEVPVTDPEAQKALAFAMEQYNKDRGDSDNYFKVVHIMKIQKVTGPEHHFLVELAETTCKKKKGKKIVYENVQKCEQLPGNQKKTFCFFSVVPFQFFTSVKLNLEVNLCL